MARHAAGDRVNGELHRDAPFVQLVVELAHLVLGLGHGHPVAGNNHHEARLFQDLRGPFDRFGLVDLLLPAFVRDLPHLTEGPEQHVGERAVHRLAHDDGEDETARSVEGARRDQELVVEHEAHGDGGESRVRVQDRDHCRHVGPADRDDEQNAEEQRQHDDRPEERRRPPSGRMERQRDREGQSDAKQREVAQVL